MSILEMRKVTNPAYLNKYNNFSLPEPRPVPKSVVEPIVEPILEPTPVEPEPILEPYIQLEKVYEVVAEEKIPPLEDIKVEQKVPSLQLIVQKILLQKKLEKIDGWLRR
jgi:hypothetical protein